MSGPLPPYLRRGLNPDKGVGGRKGERGLSSRIGGTLRPGSGALDGAKGDVTKFETLSECKTTIRDSMSLQLSWLHKIYQEALEVGKTPALALAFVNVEGQSKGKRDRWVCVPESVWLEMVEDLNRGAPDS
jgi:hypothetical protein